MASTDVLKVSGNYVIDARNGDITINATSESHTGKVTINGNLDVIGTTTQIETVDAIIEDNLIVLNSGEPNDYITQGSGGILISRGSGDDPNQAASIIFQDISGDGSWTVDGDTKYGIFKLSAGQGGISEGSAIQVNAIRIDVASASALNFLGDDNAFGMLNVLGTVNYEDRVIHDDDIPNKKYVDTRSLSSVRSAKQIEVGFTTLKGFSPLEVSGEFFNDNDKIEAALGTSTNVVFKLEGSQVQLKDILIDNNSIGVITSSSLDLILNPPVSQSVKIDGVLSLQAASTPSPEFGYTKVYKSDPGGGGTGVYFVNTTNTDELISRRRALLYSIIF